MCTVEENVAHWNVNIGSILSIVIIDTVVKSQVTTNKF